MSLNKPPSFVSVDAEKGKVTIAFLDSWYNEERCTECSDFKHNDDGSWLGLRREVAYCELIEKGKPCQVTGIRHIGEKNGNETATF